MNIQMDHWFILQETTEEQIPSTRPSLTNSCTQIIYGATFLMPLELQIHLDVH